MGVTVDFYAYDEAHFIALNAPFPAIEDWQNLGLIDAEGHINADKSILRDIESHMSSNKAWQQNMQAQYVFQRVRPFFDDELQLLCDRIFSLLFAQPYGEQSLDGLLEVTQPSTMGIGENWRFSAKGISHLIQHKFDLEILRWDFTQSIDAHLPQNRAGITLSPMEDVDIFSGWISSWYQIIRQVHKMPNGALLVDIWR